jgi:dephospho-CoA kinase
MTATPDTNRHPVLLVGGGIGAGKSRVGSVFQDRGFEVIEADKVGHGVLEHDVAAIEAVGALWPSVVTDGVVDRAALAAIVFADAAALAELESITHPAIADTLRRRIESAQTPVVVEIPLMRVLAGEPYVRVAVVADPATREDRAVARGASREDTRRRMSHQQSDAQWAEWADHIIDNSGEWDATAAAVHSLIDTVLRNG